MSGHDYRQDRERALAEALDLHRTRYAAPGAEPGVLDRELIATAKAVFDFLVGPVFLFLTVGPVVHQDTGQPIADPLGGNPMQLRDNEQFTATVELKSARGNDVLDQPGTQDDLSWTLEGDGAEGVLSLEVGENTRSATVKASGPVGSAVLRVESGELFATLAVDVVAGNAALIEISASDVQSQDAPGTDEPGTEPGV